MLAQLSSVIFFVYFVSFFSKTHDRIVNRVASHLDVPSFLDLILISSSSHPHLILISSSSHPHLIPSHPHITLSSFSCHPQLILISSFSPNHLILISSSSHTISSSYHPQLILMSSSAYPHFLVLSYSSHPHLILISYYTFSYILCTVFRATVLSKLLYASPAWWGFTNVQQRDRLEGFLRKATRAGFFLMVQPLFLNSVVNRTKHSFMALLGIVSIPYNSCFPRKPKKHTICASDPMISSFP